MGATRRSWWLLPLASMLAVGVAACSSGGETHTKGAGPACVASQLRLSPGPFISPATGQNPHPIRVVNIGATCRLDGYPSIQLRDRHDARLPFVIHSSGDQMVTDRAPAPVSLHRGAAAWFLINSTAATRATGRLPRASCSRAAGRRRR